MKVNINTKRLQQILEDLPPIGNLEVILEGTEWDLPLAAVEIAEHQDQDESGRRVGESRLVLKLRIS
jgi:hypothetical protein